MAADKGVFALEASIERVSELMHIGSSFGISKAGRSKGCCLRGNFDCLKQLCLQVDMAQQ